MHLGLLLGLLFAVVNGTLVARPTLIDVHAENALHTQEELAELCKGNFECIVYL